LQAALLHVNDKDHVLVVTLHHIVTDGWSMRVLFRELSVFIPHSVPECPRLSELPVQYADFAVWQRQWLQVKYWKSSHTGKSSSLSRLFELPTDRPRPAIGLTGDFVIL
jgi:hypothetical protein